MAYGSWFAQGSMAFTILKPGSDSSNSGKKQKILEPRKLEPIFRMAPLEVVKAQTKVDGLNVKA